ncbi:hypothetical protein MPSEU_000896100 [Mayamaea pseudoterrestris]|nr:hypothetical protein MPSEU_000896100 [Mayamaea pseudoterrestris]
MSDHSFTPSAYHSVRYDCTQLLQTVSNLENLLSDSYTPDFGHPDPPTVKFFASGDFCLMLAFTPHCCYVQEYSRDKPGVPLEMCRFQQAKPQQEEITCVTIVSLQDEHLLLNDGDNLTSPIEVELSNSYVASADLPTPHKSLLKGTMAGEPLVCSRIAVVIGTNASRLYSVELRVDVIESRILIDDTPLLPCEVLPADSPQIAEQLKLIGKTPFQPTGGIISLESFVNQEKKTLVWIVYGDGCLIRIQSAALFPSIWQKGALTGRSVDELLGIPAILRCQVQLPHMVGSELRKIVPLPRSFPSLAHVLVKPWKQIRKHDMKETDNGDKLIGSIENDYPKTIDPDQEDDDIDIFQAIIFSNHPTAPTASFYSSEHQFSCDGMNVPLRALVAPDADLFGALVGSTKALVGGMVGAATYKVFRFGRRNSTGNIGMCPPPNEESRDVSLDLVVPLCPFPSLRRNPVVLFAGQEIHDAPRKVEVCTIEPNGMLAAVTDNLGRVLLLNLFTKEIIRTFKGYRDAALYWVHAKRCREFVISSHRHELCLNLAIHSRQRRTLEIYQIPHGMLIQRTHLDVATEVIPYTVHIAASSLTLTFAKLLRSRVPGTPFNYMDEIQVDCLNSRTVNFLSSTLPLQVIPSHRSSTLQLQHLCQLLSTESVKLTTEAVIRSLKAILLLSDLSTALDILSKSTILENKIGIMGSGFHKLAVDCCRQTLREAGKGKRSRTMNPDATALLLKIRYHAQLIEAYDVLSTFENSRFQLHKSTMFDDLDHWGKEALVWISVANEVTPSRQCDADIFSKVRFSEFASACVLHCELESTGNKELAILFTDSTRARQNLLVRVFRPLLGDIFAANIVPRIFQALHCKNVSYLLRCFGEWVFTLSYEELRASGFSNPKSALNRFLQVHAAQQTERDDTAAGTCLHELLQLCYTSEDLVRAFALAVLCRNALQVVLMRRERTTYGKATACDVLQAWEMLMRKIRLCIVIHFRLIHVRLAAPITVANIDEDGLFSVYELLALDLMSASSSYNEFLSLEAACSGSSFSFDATSEAGDDVVRIMQLQVACSPKAVAAVESATENASVAHDRYGVLILFLPSYNQTSLLAAHRARLLSRIWHKSPQEFYAMEEALVTLKRLSQTVGMTRLAFAVALDVWQSTISPLYRAQLFGIQNVRELEEATFGPLLLMCTWCHQFGLISIQYLDLLRNIQWTDEGWEAIESAFSSSTSWDAWPTIRTDHILKDLVKNSQRVDVTALDAHLSIICGLIVSDDIHALSGCVPALHDCFTSQSLYVPVGSDHVEKGTLRIKFLQDAVVTRSCAYSGPPLESFSLAEIDLLCQVWQIDLWAVRTCFLRCMYELGKDGVVDDLTTKGTASFDVTQFIKEGLDIVCMRLHTFLGGDEMQTPAMRGIIGLLDAELCEWIQHRAMAMHHMTAQPVWEVPISLTHRLALRLLGLCTSRVEPIMRIKIHSLTVSSGVLVNLTPTYKN